VSNVHRLRLSDRIFFVSVNLRRALARFSGPEYALIGAATAESRQQVGFLFLGYVLMPDHWHALIWPAYPLTISRVIQDIKWISSRSVNAWRGAHWQITTANMWSVPAPPSLPSNGFPERYAFTSPTRTAA
jgi:REP element-mobilizing transposase RayT